MSTTVAAHHGDTLREELAAASLLQDWVTLPEGEENKTLATWQRCVDGLLEARVDRKTPVVAFGGGVVGDIAGFAAASTLRGLPYVQVPTTLLAMVDSSVGGKTGVNHPRGKNLVGAFHQPRLVWAGLATLGTLAPRQLRAGLGEVVKTALIAGEAALAVLEVEAEALARGEPAALARQVATCVRTKAAVVAEDEREAGVRAWLNLGHTVGHGLENALGYGALLHGEAVGLGLLAEHRWAEESGHATPGLAARIESLLSRLGLPVEPPKYRQEAVVTAMHLDKKAYGAMVRVPICVRPGQVILLDLERTRLPELLQT